MIVFWTQPETRRRRVQVEPVLQPGKTGKDRGNSVEGRRPFRATITIVVFGVASIVTYVMLSLVTNAQPPTSPNTGWVALLQPAVQPWQGQIELQASAAVPGAPGEHPSLTYSVIACGDQPFRGTLLLGGQAQLDGIIVTDQHLATNTDTTPNAPRVNTVPNLALGFEDTIWHLGSVQEIPIVIDQPDPCAVSEAGDKELIIGAGTTATGVARGAVELIGNVWGINGPRTIQSWPLVGGLPPAPPNLFGRFTGIDGMEGEWIIPPALNKRIASGSLTARATVDGAIPPLADTSKILWESKQPFRASARVTNIDDLERWQNLLMASGIVLGVGASLLTSLLFEWLRSTREASPVVSSTSVSPLHEGDVSASSPPSRSNAALVFATLAVVAYLSQRRWRR